MRFRNDVMSMCLAGFNVSLTVIGTNRTVTGLASQLPAGVLQAPSPSWSASLQRLSFTLRLQGMNMVPLTASLQRELVSSLLHVSLLRQVCLAASLVILHRQESSRI